jgi:hypothetical protein
LEHAAHLAFTNRGLFAILHYTEILSLGAFTNYARNMLPRAGERVFTKEELSKHDGKFANQY